MRRKTVETEIHRDALETAQKKKVTSSMLSLLPRVPIQCSARQEDGGHG